MRNIKIFLGRPFDLRSLLISSNNSVPYLYFILLSSTILSVGVSFARLLTKGKNPVIKRVFSFKFLKVIVMLILKFMVQSYVLAMAVKSLMYKFVSKVKNSFKSAHKYYLSDHSYLLCFSFNTFTIHLMTQRLSGHLKKDTTGMEFVHGQDALKPISPNIFVM